MGGARTLGGKSALVTGASGFIGAALTRRLVELGAVVHAVAGPSGRTPVAGATWWHTRLDDLDAVRALLDATRPALLFHLAGHVSAARDLQVVLPTLSAGLLGTVHLLTAASERGCERVVLAGSLEEPEPDAAWPVPSSPYAAAKLAASTYARMFHALYRTPVVVLRVFMVYGPAQPDTKKLVPYVTRALLRGEPPLLSSGERKVDWVYVEDVVDAFLAAAVSPGVEGRTLEIGSGELVTVRQIVEQLVAIVRPRVAPSFGALADRPMEQVRVARTQDAITYLGWRASTPLQEGLRRTVAWYRAHEMESARS